MNIDRKVLVLASFPAIMLGGCNFNEDFCIREGELVAWCDFSGIKEKPPVPQERHVIPFGTDVPYSEGTTFTQDTLRWSLCPRGHTGSCSIRGTMNCWTGMTIMRRVCPSGLTPLTGRRTFQRYRNSAVPRPSVKGLNTGIPNG